MDANSRTIAGRAIGASWWNHVPSAAMRISLCPQCAGFQLATGGTFRSAAIRAMSASDRRLRFAGGSGEGMRAHVVRRRANRKAMTVAYGVASAPQADIAALMIAEFSEPRTAIVTGAAKRIGSSIAEALLADGWYVLVHCHTSRAEAEERFGPALRWGRREEAFHEVGSAILIHEEKLTEYFLMAREGLSEAELTLLDVELLQLIGEGQDVHTYGGGPVRGTFEHDIVHSPVYSRPTGAEAVEEVG